MIKKGMNLVGATMFMVGMAGMAGACEGQGSFLISAIVFSVGLGISWKTFREV